MKKLLSTLERLRPPTPAPSSPPSPTDGNPNAPRTPDRAIRSEEELTPQSPFTLQQSSLRPVPFREHSSSSVLTISSLSKSPVNGGAPPVKPSSTKRKSVPRIYLPIPPTPSEILSYRYHHGVNLDGIFTLKHNSCGEIVHENGNSVKEADAVESYAKRHGVSATRSKLESHWKESISENHWEWLAEEAGVTTVRLAIHWPSSGPVWCEGTPFESVKEVYLNSYAHLKSFISTARRHEIGVILNIQHPPLPYQHVTGHPHSKASVEFWKHSEYRTIFASLISFICQQTLTCPIMSQTVAGLQFLHESHGSLVEAPEQDTDFHEWYEHVMHIIHSINPALPIYVPSILNRKAISKTHRTSPINSNENREEESWHSQIGPFKNPVFSMVKEEHGMDIRYRIEPRCSHNHSKNHMTKGQHSSPGFFWDWNPEYFPHNKNANGNTHHIPYPPPPTHLTLPLSTTTHLRTHALSKKIVTRQSAATAYKRSLCQTHTKRLSIEEESQERACFPPDDHDSSEKIGQNPSHEVWPIVPPEILTEAFTDGWDLGFTDALAFWGGDCVVGNCGGGDRIGQLDYWVKRRVYGTTTAKGNGCGYADMIFKEAERHLDELQLEEADKEMERAKEREKAHAKIAAYEKGVRDGICDFEFVVGISERNSWRLSSQKQQQK